MRIINNNFAQVVLDASEEAFFTTDCFSPFDLAQGGQIAQIKSNFKIGTKEFDVTSYGIFLEGLKYVKDKKIINKITQRIGRRIFEYFRKNNKFLLTGNPDDIKSWQADLEKLVKCLTKVGYLKDGKIIWKGKREFLYQMKDPVILPSATKLFNQYGIAQHYSSRTIEALLTTYKIRAKENENFNPNKYSKDLVIEHWIMTRTSK